jgi:hypothetical protein
MYSATGTRVLSCRSFSASFCSGVMYTVVEIFFRAMAETMHDHTPPVNAQEATGQHHLMRSGFAPSLGDMTSNRAPRHLSFFLAAALGGGAAVGCASKQQGPAVGAGAIQSGIQVDLTRCDPRGKQVVATDTDNDKKTDVTKLYEVREVNGAKVQILACKQVDLNHDDRVDIVYHYDQAGTLSFEEFDLDFDGRYDLWSYYQGGHKVREEMDTNYDRRPDFTKFFEGDKMVRVERDTNNDGKVDQWEYYENGKLDRIGYDSTGSGRADKWDRAPDDVAGGATSNAETANGATAAAAPPPAIPSATPPPAPAAPAKR